MSTSSTPEKNTRKSHKWAYLYALYLGIDNGKLSMSMIKYSFEILLANGDLATKAMQEWIKSPTGAIISILSFLGMASCSLLAHYADKEDKKTLRAIIILWPYARDSMKNLRNALRGVTSTLNLLYILDLQDMRHLIIPIGLFVGCISALNRIWIRYKSEQGEVMLATNTHLLLTLEDLKTLSPQQIDGMRRKIAKQSDLFQTCSLLAAGLSGLIDGINPYIGSLALGTLSSSLLLLITTFCSVYFCAILTIRIHDEINLQRKLSIAQKKVELTLLEKEITMLIDSLTQISEDWLISNDSALLDEDATLSTYLNFKLEEQEREMHELSQITCETPAFLQGVKKGLNAYKNVMLTFSTCVFLSPVKLPSLVSEHRALLGMSTLGAGVLYSCTSSFLWQWIETIKSYFEQNNKLQEPSAQIKVDSSVQNQNRFFSHPLTPQELNHSIPELCASMK